MLCPGGGGGGGGCAINLDLHGVGGAINLVLGGDGGEWYKSCPEGMSRGEL